MAARPQPSNAKGLPTFTVWQKVRVYSGHTSVYNSLTIVTRNAIRTRVLYEVRVKTGQTYEGCLLSLLDVELPQIRLTVA